MATRQKRRVLWVAPFLCFGLVGACNCGGPDDGGSGPDAAVGWSPGPPLPEPRANNALASIETEGGCMIFSLLGIGPGTGASDIQTSGFRLREGDDAWISLPPVPGPARLAANAVGLRGAPYLLGGYEVLEGGTEVSSDLLQRFNLRTGQWDPLAPIPIPIDDAGVVAWQDRYIVVVSGWSTTDNVTAVQIYDAEDNSWASATPFPGDAVFGSSLALSGNEMVLIDGVANRGLQGFSLVNQAYRGILDPENPTEIAWTDLGGHPGPARYRAAPVALGSSLWFHGGTQEPYNFDGLRYDNGQPSTPLASTLVFQEGGFQEEAIADKPEATMDHRNLVLCGGRAVSVGGMVAGPEVTDSVWFYTP